MKLIKTLTLLSLVMIFATCQKETKPRLVILIAVDHLSQTTYSHYSPAFTGGFKWLNDKGIAFSDANHEHGYTATGPGHFVLGSGLYPGPAGVLGNYWYDRIKGHDVYCVDDPDAKSVGIQANHVSYDKINGSSFGDWLKAASPNSRVYSVACKDRAAIMMGGKNPDLAVWYNWNGAFTTTDFYADSIPDWLHSFNSKNNFSSYRDSLWDHSRPEALYAEYAHADSFYGETDRYMDSIYTPVLPIGFEPEWDDQKMLSRLGGYPWMDRMTLDLASTAIDEGQLGQDDIPDVLTIGLSAFDLIAHYYGPYSHEAMDHLLRVDDYLKAFLDRLDQQVGLENVVIAISSDHGGLPLPEHWTSVMGKSGGRVDESQYLATRAKAYVEIDSLYGNHDFIHRKGSSYYYNFSMMDSMGVDQALISSILQRYMEPIDGVHRLYTKAELLAADGSDYRTRRLKNFMHPVLSPDLYTEMEPGWLFRNPFGTSHSTPYEYDSHVMLIFAQAGNAPRQISNPVSTADIAPTLGDVLGVKPTNPVDGKSFLTLIKTQ